MAQTPELYSLRGSQHMIVVKALKSAVFTHLLFSCKPVRKPVFGYVSAPALLIWPGAIKSGMWVMSLVFYFLNYTLGLHSSSVFNTPSWTSHHDSRVCVNCHSAVLEGNSREQISRWEIAARTLQWLFASNIVWASYLPANPLGH